MFGILLLLLLLSGFGTSSATVAKVDYNIYHHMDDLISAVKAVVEDNPSRMKFDQRKASDEDYSATIVSFGQHGRELITTELALHFIKTLQNTSQIRQVLGSDERGDRLYKLLDKVSFKILPMENANGRRLVEKGQLCERKNGRGVDVNRNWGVDFGVKEKDYDPKEEYPGKHAFSEPEAQIVLNVAKTFQPHVWLNVHSGMDALFMPYDHVGKIPKSENARSQLEMLKKLQAGSCKTCEIGSGGKTVGYLAHGTATDYMFEELGIPLAFTWEIFGDNKASYHDCFKAFNPVTREAFEEVISQWTKALYLLLELLPSHPALEHFSLEPESSSGGASTTEDFESKMQTLRSQTDNDTVRVIKLSQFSGGNDISFQDYFLYSTLLLVTAALVATMVRRHHRKKLSRN